MAATLARSHRPVLRCEALEDRINLSPPVGPGPTPAGVGYSFTNWPAEPLNDIALTSTNTYPIVGPSGQAIRATEDWIIRDPFPVTDLDGKLARIGGWYVVAGLATPRNDAVGTLREFRYLISPDGVNWQEGGLLITSDDAGPGALGDQLFSGDFRYDAANNRLLLYYTPVVGSNPAEYVQSPSGRQMRQEIAVAQVTPQPTSTGLTFTNFVQYGIKLVPDGKWYTTPENANTETEVYGFRDPYLFKDPETGISYLMFVANWGTDQQIGYNGGVTGDQLFPDAGPQNVDPNRPRNDGVVGLAVATDATLTNWRLLPPIFGGIGVNEQIELPHVIHNDGLYYLYVSTHNRTFIGDLKYDYPEGFYGFVADDLQGPYRPLNGTSLVFSNPPVDELQNYGWKAVDIGDGRATVLSFINKNDSGTISPVVTIKMDGDTSVIDKFQAPSGSGAPQPTVLAFGVTPTVPAGTLSVSPPANRPPVTQPPNGPRAAQTSAAADFTGDGTPDVVFASPGGVVRIINGATGAEVRNFTPYPGFAGPVSVAVADVTGDGQADIVTGTAAGAAHVKVFDGATGQEVRSFFAFDGFAGGVSVAAADLNGDGKADIVVGTATGAAHVKVFDGATAALLRSFFAFQGFTGGVSVAAADLDGDGTADLIVGAGAGAAGGHVKAFDGATGAERRSFFAFDGFTGGVNVAAADVDGDGRADILVGTASGAAHVKAFGGRAGDLLRSFFALQGFGGGVNVSAAGGRLAVTPLGSGPGLPPGRVFDVSTFDVLREFGVLGGPAVG